MARARPTSVAVAIFCAACGSGASSPGSADGAATEDTGTPDAGKDLDSGPRADGAGDSSTPADTGSRSDSSVPADSGSPETGSPEAGPSSPGLHVAGNQLLNENGTPVRLLGVNRSGTEYMCIQGNGIFDGPNDQASITAMTGWKANAVRVPLNEDCWLAINGAPAQYAGAAYQQAISAYVSLLVTNGIYPILDLHWNAPGTMQATGQQPMPDSDHSIDFWTQVATTFGGDDRVVLELYNEPYPDNNNDTTAAWTCWRDGGSCPSVPYPVAGMQTLVTAVRNAGATNVVLLGGVQYSNALSQWLTYEPSDPLHGLAAAWHVYNFNGCNNTQCYDTTAGPVAQAVPIVTTEIGEDDCAGSFITPLMTWLDSKSQSYLAWVWDTWGPACTSIALVSDYTGTPNNAYGQTYKDHLAVVPH